MFLVRYFRDSFKFKTLLITKDKTLVKSIIFFLLMIIIATFPMSLDAVKNRGTRLDFIIEHFRENTLNWDMPSTFEIKGGKLITNGSNDEYIYEYKDITYIINFQGELNHLENKSSIIFQTDVITFINDKGEYMTGHGYQGFVDVFSFKEFELASPVERTKLYEQFAENIEKSFSNQIVLFTVLRNTTVQIFTNLIYILVLSLLVQLYKFGYEKFMSYKEGLMFVLLAMGLPALLSFGVGFIAPAFSPVIFQISSGMIVMLVPLIFGKKIYT